MARGMKVRVGHDGAYCGACGVRLGDAFGPSSEGRYFMALNASWHVDDQRTWRKSRHRGRSACRRQPAGVSPQKRAGVQPIDKIKCSCGETLTPP
jgi:hypothetical protein